jgi:two-component system CheB/CheR fusion protein
MDGDAVRLAQVVGNLLTNAAKFANPGGRTEVSVAREAPATAVVRVRDDGIGIAPEVRRRLFEPFAPSAETVDRNRGGLGLGLALVKSLVELHGGEVSARSDGLGLGTEFVVSLPLAPDVAPLATPAPDAGSRSRHRRVLVIDDNVDAADSLREVLALGGHEVAVAYSGPEGIERARELRPEVVLCDIGLPGMDGYGVARALRSDPALGTAFLVALSGYALAEDLERARAAGFDRHVAKPPSADLLEEVLTSALDRDARPDVALAGK